MQRTKVLRRSALTLAVASLAVTGLAGPAAADPPTNSSFENPSLGPDAAILTCAFFGGGGITGWSVSDGCVALENGAAGAADGFQRIRIPFSEENGNGVIRQQFTTQANTGYTITWNYGATGPSVQTGTFSVEGAAVETMTATGVSSTDPNWQTASTTFTGTGGPVTLQFASTGTGTGLVIDNVVIAENSEVPIVDPMVAGIAIVLVGGAGLYLLHRKRNGDPSRAAVAV